MKSHYDIVIIGGGPAGMTAAIYAGRASKSVLIIENAVLGGIMASVERIDNYPAFVTTSGADLTVAMQEQVLASGGEIEYATVQKLDSDSKTILLDDGTQLTATNIIIATGAGSKKLGLGKEEPLTGNGVSYCATCDGAFFKEKTVALTGSSVHTTTDAIYLLPIVSHLDLIVPDSKLKGLPEQIKMIEESPKVTIMYNTRVTELKSEKKGMREVLTGIKAKNAEGKDFDLNCDALFVALGSMPNSQVVFGQVATDKSGGIVTDNKMSTDKQGIYAIGDVRANAVKQVVVACSDGAIAINSIIGRVVYASKK